MNQTRKKRYARRLDENRHFKPQGIPRSQLKACRVHLDEFEAIRLIDIEGMNQIDAATEMEVSRATIQRLLRSGRKKIAIAILENCALEITNDIHNIKLKGENKMNIAAKPTKIIAFPTSDRTTIDGHFGHTREFAIYTVEDTDVTHVGYVTPPPHEPGVLPRFLAEKNVDVIVTGGMGQRAVTLFEQHDIDVILGAKGRIDVNLNEYLGGFLSSQGSSCDPHEGEHHHRHEHHHE